MSPKMKDIHKASMGRMGEENIMRKGLAIPVRRTALIFNAAAGFLASYADMRASFPVSLRRAAVLRRMRTGADVSFPTIT